MKTTKDILLMIRYEGMFIPCTALHCYLCRNRVRCDMLVIAYDVVRGGDY